jgi:hypothetical protein
MQQGDILQLLGERLLVELVSIVESGEEEDAGVLLMAN